MSKANKNKCPECGNENVRFGEGMCMKCPLCGFAEC